LEGANTIHGADPGAMDEGVPMIEGDDWLDED
jgi:hypothetical protein